MKAFPMFDNIEYTEDIEVMRKWIPLMMKGRQMMVATWQQVKLMKVQM